MNEVPTSRIGETMTTPISEFAEQLRWTASQKSKAMTMSIMKRQGTIKIKQQLSGDPLHGLAKEVLSRQITKFRRERIIPSYKDETWSADLIDKSSLRKFNNNYKFILTVIDIFTKYAWAISIKIKTGLYITNGFKIVLDEEPQARFEDTKPEKLWGDRGNEFHNKTFKYLLKEYETELYSTYSDLKAVFIERCNLRSSFTDLRSSSRKLYCKFTDITLLINQCSSIGIREAASPIVIG